MQSVTGSARPSELGNKQVQLVQELLQKGGATRVERPDRTTSSRQSRLRAAFQQLKRDTTLLLKREVNTANKACRFDSKFEYKSGVSILAQAARGKPFGVSSCRQQAPTVGLDVTAFLYVLRSASLPIDTSSAFCMMGNQRTLVIVADHATPSAIDNAKKRWGIPLTKYSWVIDCVSEC
eukprot:1159486-Pelagomonas_calceolata.AAC.6